jgi:hypothetical protein
MAALALLLAVGAVALIWVTHRAPSAREVVPLDRETKSGFVPDPNNRTALVVRGCNRTDLDRILVDFQRLYDVPPAAGWTTNAAANDVFMVAFPNDIEPGLLFHLVNYLQYSRNFDLPNRSLGVLCHVVLGPAFGIPDAALAGKRAVIYVPASDTAHDLVYAKIESGKIYRIPFADLTWEPVEDARMPDNAKDL